MITIRLYVLILTFSWLGFSSVAQVGNLIWEDNFNEGQLDLTKWSIETGTGVNGDWGTGQLDRATSRTENVSFQDGVPGAENGCLVITTRKEFYIDRNYTSGRINTANKSSWGPGHRIIIRAYPRDVKHKGQGFAFWMMPDEIPDGWDYIMWPQGGEIDIMEYVGSIPFHNLGSVHYAWFWKNNQWQSWNHGHQGYYYSYENNEVPNPAEPGYGGYPAFKNDMYAGWNGFHTYGIDWYDNRIEFHVDENVYHIHYLSDGDAFDIDGEDETTISQIDSRRVGVSEYSNHFSEWYPFEHKMYAILSAGVGGSQNTYGGAIVPEATFPCSVFIDWVKVYQLGTSTALEEHEKSSDFKVFPNPARDVLNIEIDNPDNYTLKITDISGKMVYSSSITQSNTVNISDFESGTYLVSLNNGEITVSKRIIIG